jgi:8-oxo-dGTP diphosphatase
MSLPEIDVAVAIIRNAQGQVLVNQRQTDKEHAGYWEFPGGKFESGESPSQALIRECKEELGISVMGDAPLMELSHAYPNKNVRLHVRVVSDFKGAVRALEGQKLHWLTLTESDNLKLLPADIPILKALAKHAVK